MKKHLSHRSSLCPRSFIALDGKEYTWTMRADPTPSTTQQPVRIHPLPFSQRASPLCLVALLLSNYAYPSLNAFATSLAHSPGVSVYLSY